MNCSACGNDRQDTVLYSDVKGLDLKLYDIVSCNNCRFVTISPMPSTKYIRNFYEKNYNGLVKTNITEFNESSLFIKQNLSVIEDSRERIQWVINKTHLRPTNELAYLDFGCGYGFSVLAGKEIGFSSSGVDFDEAAVLHGKNKLSLDLKCGGIDVLTQKYDLITEWQVFEHVVQPFDHVQSIYDLLNDNGYFSGTIPNIGGVWAKIKKRNWYMICPPEHINYFSEDTITLILERAGFNMVFVGTMRKTASPLINFGIRRRLNLIIKNSQNNMIKGFFTHLYRMLTLIKRNLLYRPLSYLIMIFKIGGNSIFFIAKKNKINNEK